MMLGGAVAATLLIGSIGFAGYALTQGHAAKNHPTAAAPKSVAPSPAASASAPPTPMPSSTGPAQPNIDDVRTDPRPLTLTEVFPNAQIALGGKPYRQDKTAVNHDCTLAARGGMAEALGKEHCEGVVRATYVQGKKYAVTLGIAALPTKQAAMTVSHAGDPSKYEWFRGLSGPVATKIDSAGGYSASTVLGRYLIYSYAQYADGTKPQPNDQALRALAADAIDYAKQPIVKRAQ